jgi:uncharacterized membrane protein
MTCIIFIILIFSMFLINQYYKKKYNEQLNVVNEKMKYISELLQTIYDKNSSWIIYLLNFKLFDIFYIKLLYKKISNSVFLGNGTCNKNQDSSAVAVGTCSQINGSRLG